MKKKNCWKKEKGTYFWSHKKEPDLTVSIMKAPGDKKASLIMGKGDGKETNPKTVAEAKKLANKYMKKHNQC